jgi:hypothetical protein
MVCVSAQKVTPRPGKILGLLVIFSLVVSSGCSRGFRPQSLTQRSVDARELYRDSAFRREHLQRDGVSCLTAQLSFGHETYGYTLVQKLAETLQAQFADGKVVHPNLVASHVNEAGLADEYAAMLTTYDKTHILPRDTLRKIADAARVRYFAVPILVNFQEGGATRLSFFGVRLAKTAWTTARFQLQIWDGRSGRIVWEGISDLTLAQELIWERPVRFEDTIQATWESIIEHIPTDSVSPVQGETPASL